MRDRVSTPLEQFHAQMGTINDLVFQLTSDSPPAALADVRDALMVATSTISGMIGLPRGTTDCRFHPQGPIDPVAPEGWSNCLLCNTHRRRSTGGHRSERPPSSSN